MPPTKRPADASSATRPTWRRIRSATDEYQVVRALRSNRQKRNSEGLFLVDGVRSINAAITNGWDVPQIISYVGCKRSAWANAVVASVNADLIELPSQLFDDLIDRDERPELIVVARKRKRSLMDIPINDRLLAVVLDRPSSPGNIGTIVRTSDALGADVVIVLGHAADVYDPRTIRASTGSFFAIPTVQLPEPSTLRKWLTSSGVDVEVIATDETGSMLLTEVELARPMVLLLGNETTGLTTALRELATSVVAIPMTGWATSLNVAAAHAICLYEVERQERSRF